MPCPCVCVPVCVCGCVCGGVCVLPVTCANIRLGQWHPDFTVVMKLLLLLLKIPQVHSAMMIMMEITGQDEGGVGGGG